MTEKNTESDALILPPPDEPDSLIPQDNEEDELSFFDEDVIKDLILDKDFMLDNILHARKMSKAFFDFIEPYYDSEKDDEESLRQLLNLAQFAWNLSFESKKEQNNEMKKLSTLSVGLVDNAKAQVTIKSLIQSMIVRRKRYFANFKRLIIDFAVEDHEDEVSLVVVSKSI